MSLVAFKSTPFSYPMCRSDCRFDSVTDLLEPVEDGRRDNCFISKSYDATSHFETAADDVLSLYTRITGDQLDMTISADMNDEDA
jgi:Rab GDP dissociation inhibitor